MQRLDFRQLTAILTGFVVVLFFVTSDAAMKKRDEIDDKYKWDLSDIYGDWDEWAEGMATIDAMIDQYAGLKGTLAEGPEHVVRAYQLADELSKVAYKVYRYPALASALDLTDNDLEARVKEVNALFQKIGMATSWLNPEILSISWETMEDWLSTTPELAPYNYPIENLYRQQEHVLDAEMEEFLAIFDLFLDNAATPHRQLSVADMEWAEIEVPGEEDIEVSEGEYRKALMTNYDQAERAKYFELLYGVYHKNKNTYASIYDNVLQRDWAQAKARNYPTTAEAALDGDNVPVSVMKNLIAAVWEGIGPVHRYNALRKKALGLTEYHGYDGAIPLVDFSPTYDFDQAIEWIIESVEPLGDEYQAMMREAVSNRWIDVYETPGKRGGAFQADVYGVHPYLLLNYNGTLYDVSTISHELGHTMHTMFAEMHQPKATANYPIFVAEVPSTLSQALFHDYMLERAKTPEERIAFLLHGINDLIGTFYVQVMFADFELQAHEMVERGESITADVLTELYTGLLNDFRGGAVEPDDLYGYNWTRIGHFYRSPYYVYKYATCYASAAQLLKGIRSDNKRERKEAIARYMNLLKAGGSDYPMDLLKEAGADLTDPQTFQAVIDQLDHMVTQLEGEMAKLETKKKQTS